MDFNGSALFLQKMIEENKEDKELVKELLLTYRNLTDKTAEITLENIKANSNINLENIKAGTNQQIEQYKENTKFNIENNRNNMTFSIAQHKENTNLNIEYNKLPRLNNFS